MHSVLDLPADLTKQAVGLGRGRLGDMGPFHPKSHLSCLIPHPASPQISLSPVSVPPKVCLDLSAEYLILSDVQRKVGCSGSRGKHWGDEGVCGSSGVFLAPELSCDPAACAGPST